MTETNFQEAVLLLREARARLGGVATWDPGRIQGWVIGAGVFIAVLLCAAGSF